MGHGGPRQGAGRKKGSRNKATVAREAAVKASGVAPLEFLIECMRDEAAPQAERIECAKAAAPYVHPKLSAVEFSGEIGRSRGELAGELAELPAEVLEVLRRHAVGANGSSRS